MKRKWCSFQVLGSTWPVYLGDSNSFPEYFDEACVEGYTDYASNFIVVRYWHNSSRENLEKVLYHELKHAVITAAGQRVPLFNDNASKEERFIIAVADAEYSALKSLMGRRYLFRKPPAIANGEVRDQNDA